ncbi:MAG: hypothetical protein BWY92_01407 [Firmicutes bacterium ADurb.BinA052]|nr:MAG: hypothetical protein BWY92_01407 [Firmicutes bacterium ADurb.BinA052]
MAPTAIRVARHSFTQSGREDWARTVTSIV